MARTTGDEHGICGSLIVSGLPLLLGIFSGGLLVLLYSMGNIRSGEPPRTPQGPGHQADLLLGPLGLYLSRS